MSMKLMAKLFLSLAVLFCFGSCKYSLSGYEINASSAKVAYFENQAPIQSAELSQILTNKLESRILRETSLKLVNEDAELLFSGAIIGYELRPAGVSGTENTEQMQLRVSVHVEYENQVDESKSFSQTFSANENYNANQDLSVVESQLLESITNQIVTEIFNKAFVNW